MADAINSQHTAVCIGCLLCVKAVYFHETPPNDALMYYNKTQDWPAHFNTEISSDGAGFGVGRVGLSEHHSSSLDNIQTLPHLNATNISIND